MAKNTNVLYGLSQPLVTELNLPIVAQRAPLAADLNYELGTIWIDRAGQAGYVLTDVSNNAATWQTLATAVASFASVTVTDANDNAFTATNGGITVNLDAIVGNDVDAGNDINAGNDITAVGTITAGTGMIITTGGITSVGDVSMTDGNVLIATDAVAHTIAIGNNTGATSVAITSGTGDISLSSTDAITLAAAGLVTIDSTGGALDLGNNANAFDINIGTGGARTITIGNNTALTAVIIDVNGPLNLGTTANSHVTTLGSTNTSAQTIIQAGTAGLSLSAAGIVTMAPVTNTQASPSATSVINANVGVATFTGFTTVSTAEQVFIISNTKATVTSAIFVSTSNEGANDAQMTITRVFPKAGSFEVTLTNNGPQALNGNVIISFWIIA